MKIYCLIEVYYIQYWEPQYEMNINPLRAALGLYDGGLISDVFFFCDPYTSLRCNITKVTRVPQWSLILFNVPTSHMSSSMFFIKWEPGLEEFKLWIYISPYFVSLSIYQWCSTWKISKRFHYWSMILHLLHLWLMQITTEILIFSQQWYIVLAL